MAAILVAKIQQQHASIVLITVAPVCFSIYCRTLKGMGLYTAHDIHMVYACSATVHATEQDTQTGLKNPAYKSFRYELFEKLAYNSIL